MQYHIRPLSIFFVSITVLLLQLALVSVDGVNSEVSTDAYYNKTEASMGIVETNASNIETKGAAIVGNAIEEKKRSLAIFFILLVLVLATLTVHMLIISNITFIPESLAIVILGSLIGSILRYTSNKDWSEIEALSPDVFFLILLPPMIFEGAYNINKGSFFSNFVPILTFAILGTTISSIFIGLCLYVLGLADLIYKLNVFEAVAFGSMISAVDPVATLAIFNVVKVDELLRMLVFGESMLNDAVSIVFAATALQYSKMNNLNTAEVILSATSSFIYVFVLSAALGTAIGLISALLFKHVDLRKTHALEFALLIIFSYIPYGFAESINLSGIVAILFVGLCMSQYTRQNISLFTHVAFQTTLRTISFVAETCTFAYLGLAFFTIKLNFQTSFILWTIMLCLVGRALSIFPLSYCVNKCRPQVQINTKNQIIMWFSGMRGAVCFALALYMDIPKETKTVILTSTLFLILFTMMAMGGAAMPFISFINTCYPNVVEEKKRTRRNRTENREARRKKRRPILSKTHEMAQFADEEWNKTSFNDKTTKLGSFMSYLFVRKFTEKERQEERLTVNRLTQKACLLREESTEDDETGLTGDDVPLIA
ncbi:hypothetical protein WR25_16109 [Diploscapter pachys]|uniref:Sodium/hydrogen exchanger n=1 Tax=Diploscapter pachys TaxID=2018661 RepID=A0A2A2LAP8_9BILA|nr:hypothetical protein WR25_16109 [Diploscapter pachys]